MSGPAIRVVVTAPTSVEHLPAILETLGRDAASQQAEVVIACGPGGGARVAEAHPFLKLSLIEVDRPTPARLRRVGSQESDADRVAFLDAEYLPGPGWLTAASRVPEHESGARGGPVLLAPGAGPWARAYYLCEYASLMPRPVAASPRGLPIGNWVCPRRLVPTVDDDDWGVSWSRALTESGVALAMTPELSVTLVRGESPLRLLTDRYEACRRATMRILRGAPIWRRLVHAALAPFAIAPLELWRRFRWTSGRRQELISTLPRLVALLEWGAIGAAVGALRAPRRPPIP